MARSGAKKETKASKAKGNAATNMNLPSRGGLVTPIQS